MALLCTSQLRGPARISGLAPVVEPIQGVAQLRVACLCGLSVVGVWLQLRGPARISGLAHRIQDPRVAQLHAA